MNTLLALIRIRPVLVTLAAIAGSLLTYFLVWPSLISQDRGRQGALLLAGLMAVWAVTEWVVFALQRYREQQTRPGQLRRLFAGALRHLIRESHGSGWGGREAVLSCPWLLMLSSPESGSAKLLERAGFRRIASCALSSEPPLCTFWLMRDGAGASVCIDVSGSALLDTEGCEQLYRWLRRLRTSPDAVLVTIGLQELWGTDEERARMVAVQMSPALHTLLREISIEQSIHIVCNQLARIEGLIHYFASAERRPWGFRIDRPLHSEFQASLIDERADAIIEGLWLQASRALIANAIESPDDVEVVLDFPREMRRVGVLLGAFTAKLCETFSADTRARLYELFLTSSEVGVGSFEAARNKRLPLAKNRTAAQQADIAHGSYFVQGVFARVVQLCTNDASSRAPRQHLAMWGAAVACVFFILGASRVYQHFHRIQDSVRKQVRVVLKTSEELVHTTTPDPIHRGSVRQELAGYLKTDAELAYSLQKLDSFKPKISDNRIHGVLEEFRNRVMDYSDCQAASHLVAPLLRYNEKDALGRNLQPLYDRLGRLWEITDPKRRAAKTAAVPSLGTADWFEALRAIALLQRRTNCTAKDQDIQWLVGYLRQLWSVDSEVFGHPLGDQFRDRTSRLLTRYLQRRDTCGLLPEHISKQSIDRTNAALSNGSTLFGQPGLDIPAVLELELRINELRKVGSTGKAYAPQSLSYLQFKDSVPFESTRSGCQQWMNVQASELSWLKCILPDASASSIQSENGGVGHKRLASQYALRLETHWSSWMRQLTSKPRKSTGTVENDLAELSTTTGLVLQELPALFRSIGVGDQSKGESAVCKESLRGLAPFRWAVGGEDEDGRKESPELEKLWQEYVQELTTVKDLLNQLGRPIKPLTHEESLKTQVLPALASLQRMEDKRINWLRVLGTELQVRSPSGAVWKDSLVQLGKQLQRLEADILQALLIKGRRQIACLWSSLKTQWSDAVSAPTSQGGATGEGDPRSVVRNLLIRFRQIALEPVLRNAQTCDPLPFPMSESIGDVGGVLASAGFCREVRRITDLTGASGAMPGDGKDREPSDPTIIPVPDGNCRTPDARIRQMYLDVPELKARFVCNISQRSCRKLGPTDARKVQLQVEYDRGGFSSAVLPWNSLRDLIQHGAPVRTVGNKNTHTEQDPWTQSSRYVIEVPGQVLCQGRNFRIYFDESMVNKLIGKHSFGDTSLLDSATPHLSESCR